MSVMSMRASSPGGLTASFLRAVLYRCVENRTQKRAGGGRAVGSDEGGGDDLGGDVGAAEVDFDVGAFLHVGGEEGQGDALLEHRGEVAARDRAGDLAVHQHRAAVTWWTASLDQQAAQ